MGTSCRRCRRNACIEIVGDQFIEYRRDGTTETHRILVPSPFTQNIFDSLTGSLFLHPAPCFLLLDGDDGHLGTYDAPNLLIVGNRDAVRHTQALLGQHGPYLKEIYYDHLFHGQTFYPTLADFALYAVVAQIAGHELGHLMDDQGHPVPAWLLDQASAGVAPDKRRSVRKEASADYLNGTRWQALGWDLRLGALISHSIGCILGAACDHPSPYWRQQAFLQGAWAVQQAQNAAFLQAQQAAHARQLKAVSAFLSLVQNIAASTQRSP